ncbi:MAG: hypothetical protein AB1752_13385 [Candidatus Zixiibacteriota bacterium]
MTDVMNTQRSDRPMTDESTYSEEEMHRKFARDCFNHVWTLMEKDERTTEEDDEMVHAAHASRFHWGKVGTPVNLARGEWQISRVYAELGSAEAAKYHALRCLSICEENNIGDFDLAFAYEAVARASALAGHKAERDQYLALAREVGSKIDKEEDRKWLMQNLDSIR